MSLPVLLAERAAIERQIQKLQSESRLEAISKVKESMTAHGLSLADISGRAASVAELSSCRPKAPKTGGTVAPKLCNPAIGETWSGRGLQPRWLKVARASGANVDDLRTA